MEEKTQNQSKLSYEQLEALASQMSQQLREANYKLGVMQNTMAIERMKFLFDVIKYEIHFDGDFVTECINEIQDSLKSSEQDSEQDSSK